MELGVTKANPNIPVFLRKTTSDREISLLFHHFGTNKPNDHLFAVPGFCNNTKSVPAMEVQCTSRDTMISRATVWVDRKVPYDQGRTYEGYREDCSGYVSMSWELAKPGYVTSTLPKVCKWISKDSLQKGDVLLNVAEHVVLFGGWADSQKSHYIAFEETRPGEGTVKRVTPYPYWYSQSSFHPCRYNSVC